MWPLFHVGALAPPGSRPRGNVGAPAGSLACSHSRLVSAQWPISAPVPNKGPEGLVPRGTEKSYLHLLSKQRGRYKTADGSGRCTFCRRPRCAAWTWDLQASSSWPCSLSWGCVPWRGPRNLVSDCPHVPLCSPASLTGQQSIRAREPGEAPNAMGVR